MSIAESALQSVLEHIVPRIESASANNSGSSASRPFKLLLSGLQGSGKSTWAAAIAKSLRQTRNRKVVVVSLDDFYHEHEDLVRIRNGNADNKMLQTRGQPGTHDETLAQRFFASIGSGDDVQIPFFDKSQFNGEGDRAPMEEWTVLRSKDLPIEVLIFEGWCLGFQALSESELEKKWSASLARSGQDPGLTSRCSTTVLQDHKLDHLKTINANLRRYNETFIADFDYLVHLDTDDLANVYRWRLDQERALREAMGRGMTEEAVVEFVRGYMPAYELYLQRLKTEAFVPHGDGIKTQLRVMLDVDRVVVDIKEL